MIIELILLATMLIGLWLLKWTVREFELKILNYFKLFIAVFILSSALILVFNAGEEKRILSVAKEIENVGGTMTIKNWGLIDGLPGETVKQFGSQVAGYEEISVNLSNTSARDLSFLRKLPKLDELDVRGTFVTEYQVNSITRTFQGCSVLK